MIMCCGLARTKFEKLTLEIALVVLVTYIPAAVHHDVWVTLIVKSWLDLRALVLIRSSENMLRPASPS